MKRWIFGAEQRDALVGRDRSFLEKQVCGGELEEPVEKGVVLGGVVPKFRSLAVVLVVTALDQRGAGVFVTAVGGRKCRTTTRMLARADDRVGAELGQKEQHENRRQKTPRACLSG